MRSTFIVLILLFLVSCKQDSGTGERGNVRIISLSPGITNTVIDAGFGELLVGRSPFCFHADQDIPVVGDLRNIDYERLLTLSPTQVFVQQTSSGTDDHLMALASQGKFELHAWPVDRVDEIRSLYEDLTQLLGDDRRTFEIDSVPIQTFKSPVLIITQGIEGTAGLSFGKETYIDDVLELMNVDNVLDRSGWISLSFEDIGFLHPKTIIVVSDSEIKESTLSGLRSLGFPVIPFVHEHVLVPSSYIVDVAVKLQEIMYSP